MDGVKKRNWRDSKPREVVKHEHHTREVVRQDFPDEVRQIVEEMAGLIARHNLELIEAKGRISDLERALGDIARQALAKAQEAA
jgi:hypothetical protein